MKKFIIICFVLFAGSAEIRAQLTNSGNIRTFTGANVTIYGDVTNNGSIADSATLITLAGSNLQTFGGSSVTTLKNLLLNNSSAAGITLAQALNVRGTLTFTDGYLNTTATNILAMTSTSAVSGVSNNSFVSGPMIKTGNSGFVFPVGKNVVYAPIAIAAPAVVTDQFTAEYFQTSPTPLYPASSHEPALNHVSECEYWMLDRTTGSSDVAVTLSWDTRSCGVTAPADLRVARWDGTQWTDKGNGGTTGSTASGTVISSAAVTTFSPFTLASSTLSNPLPIELLGFAVQCENDHAVLRWSTASEFQNDFFTIESSSDASEWSNLAVVDGAGTTTNQTNYAWTDPSTRRDAYYRISQTDYNGATIVHELIYFKSCSLSENTVSIYPNPAKSIVSILTGETISSITVLDAEGKTIGNVPVDLYYKQVNLSALPNGVYLLKIVTKDREFNERVVVMRD